MAKGDLKMVATADDIFGAASESGGPMVEPGNYVLTVAEIEDQGPSQFKPTERSILWKFTIADAANPDDIRYDSDGDPYLFFQYSSSNMTTRSKARPWAEALYGRPLEDGEKPAISRLLGRKMKALVVHVEGDDKKVRARISGEVKPTAVGAPLPKAGSAPAPAPVASPADLAALKTSYEKLRGKAGMIDVDAVAFDDTWNVDQAAAMLAGLQTAINRKINE